MAGSSEGESGGEGSGDVTRLLLRMKAGDAKAHEEIVPLVYDHLRSLAAGQFRGRGDHTLQPTALVHEAFIRLIGQDAPAWESRGHFLAVAATAMRQILIDHARKSGAQKRGGDRARVSLSDADPAEAARDVDAIALNDALERLAALDARQARIVELRVFGGLGNQEIAEVLGSSLRTVEREWRAVKAWLAKELRDFAP